MSKDPYKVVDLQQGGYSWLQWRRSKITASMSAVILGLSPWQTPLQLFNQILSGEEMPDNEAMSHGRNTESEARSWVIHQTGTAYAPVCMESLEHTWLACSLDGWDQYAEVKACEIKCPMKSVEQLNSMVDIPANYFCQMQHQMACSGVDKIYYVMYSKSSQDGVIITVKRDDLFIEKMIPLLKTFYDRLASFEPPDPIDGRDIFVLDDPEASNAASLYKTNKKVIDDLEKENEVLRGLIIKKADGRSVKIRDMKVTKVLRRGNIDYGKIEAIRGMDLEPYRKKPIESWRFS